MPMAVGGTRRYILGMLMLMVLIVGMAMGVLQRLVLMHMLVPLGEVQPDPEQHKRGGQPEQQRD